MRLSALPANFRDTALRMFPHRAPTGLVPIGRPDRDSPVLLTGNFTLTVRRMREQLEGQNAWLLVANSNGINVWCAAGGGHLTHHDVISVIRTSKLGDRVNHRRLMLPQLGATGIERRKVTDATGWKAFWGPARLEDLADVLRRGGGVHERERFMRFPRWERAEMALIWTLPMTLIGAPLLGLIGGRWVGLVGALMIAAMVFAVFLALPWLRVTGRHRWLSFALAAAAGFALGAGLLTLLGGATGPALACLGAAAVVAVGILSVDLAGTTPCLPSHINTSRDSARIELVADRCTGASDCVQVCPRAVLEMNGRLRKVAIVRPDDCIQCGACIVQCPEDALRFRFEDGRIIGPDVIRSTRMNMLGARTVQVDRGSPD